MVEREAIGEVLRHVVAATERKSYPTAVFGRRRADRCFANRVRDARWRVRLAALLAPFFPDWFSLTDEYVTFQDLVRHVEDTGDGRDGHLRAYVATSEAYNAILTATFLRGREWLNPWATWDMYLPPPMYACEHEFLRVYAMLTETPYDILVQETFGNRPVMVGDTVTRLAASIQSGAIHRTSTDDLKWELWTQNGTTSTAGVPDRSVMLVNGLRHYLSTGEVLLVRRWYGWRVKEPSPKG